MKMTLLSSELIIWKKSIIWFFLFIFLFLVIMSQNKSGYVPFVDSSSPPAPQGFVYGQPNPAGFVLPPPDYNGMPGVPGVPGVPGGAPFPPPGAFMHPMYGQGGPGFPQAPFPHAAPYHPPPPEPSANPAPNPTPYQYTPGEEAGLCAESAPGK